MVLAVPALILGAAVGRLFGGRIRNLSTARLRAVPLLVAGAFSQALGQILFDNYLLVLASFVLMLAFAVANARTIGFAVAAVGILFNLVVVGINDGMPVRRSTLQSLGATNKEINGYDFSAKRHLETPDDQLTFLGDVIPIQAADTAVSIGDLLLVVGVAIAIAELMHKHEPGHANVDRAQNGAAAD